jgi:hypothetical protein
LGFGGPVRVASRTDVREILTIAAANNGNKFSSQLLENEWEQVVDAWQLDSWEGYRDVARLGRKTGLSGKAALTAVIDF